MFAVIPDFPPPSIDGRMRAVKAVSMKHTLFATLDEMLAPDALSAYGVDPVRDVRCVPIHKGEANSGSRFYRVETNDSIGSRYILKRTQSETDPTIPALHNDLNRTVLTWQHGFLDRLSSEIVHTIVACSHDDKGYAILMHDVSDALMLGDKPFTTADHARFIDTMAAMHVEFWENAQLSAPSLGLHSPSYFFTTPGVEGWAFVEQFLESDVAKVVRTLLQNPQPLYDALSRYPSTLVHNDLWWANLGIVRDGHTRVVMLDWDFATLAPPAVELAYYIGENTGFLPASNEAVIEEYRSNLAQRLGIQFDERWWLPQVDLSLLGCFLRRGKWLLLAASHATHEQERTPYMDELAWWSKQIRRGAQRL